MTPMPVKEIVKVSSEDEKYPAINLLTNGKWLTPANNTEVHVSIELGLSEPVKLKYIDLGYCNVASVEILVRNSTWSAYKPHTTLVPTVILQSQMDCRIGKNKTGCKMFNSSDHFVQDAAGELWDRIQINLHQPYARNKQMGIEFVRLSSDKKMIRELSAKRSTTPVNRTSHILPLEVEDKLSFASSPLSKIRNDFNSNKTPGEKVLQTSSMSISARMLMESKSKEMASGANLLRDKLKALAKNSTKAQDASGSTPPRKQQLHKQSGVLTPKVRLKTSDSKPAKNSNQTTPNHRRNTYGTNMSAETRPPSTYKSVQMLSSTMLDGDCDDDLPSFDVVSPISKGEHLQNSRNNVGYSSPRGAVTIPDRNSTSKCKKLQVKESAIGCDITDDEDDGLPCFASSLSSRKVFPAKSSRIEATSSKNHTSSSTARGTIGADAKTKPSGMPRREDGSQRERNRPTSAKTKSPCAKNSASTHKVTPTPVQTNLSPTQIAEVPPCQEKVGGRSEQARTLTKAIKQFFNSLDLDSCDPDQVKVRDLRLLFEQHNNMKLNKEGKSHFLDLAKRYFAMLLSYQKPKNAANLKTAANLNHVTGGGVKRKSSENRNIGSTTSSVWGSSHKLQRVEKPSTMSLANSLVRVKCPICQGLYRKSEVEAHAANCTNFNGAQSSNTESAYGRIETPSNVSVDCSSNSCLSKEEQKQWIAYSKEPKPFQERLNRSEYEGCLLQRCPFCAQKYKASEIVKHQEDCASKVYSGSTRMGLYLVDKKEKKKRKDPESSVKTKNDVIVID